jgi:hypothetical protein
LAKQTNKQTNVTNSETDNNLIIVGAEYPLDERNRGLLKIKKDFSLQVNGTNGLGIDDAKLYIQDTDNGQRKNLNSVNDTTDKTYTGT